ncbi:alkaline phosphatase family protein [Dictyobacter kobayashii]|uniref:Acid phosphatase n=1 Tax=Dictyobacter kobayashii TaxID=2014872 RepID=A0A402ADX3_9CHLR|nr:alkaline phosphatase family protein [Dictyobacter kobayashii]GCE17309.1 acid phosphatase [Dictyobacter kobayashii]
MLKLNGKVWIASLLALIGLFGSSLPQAALAAPNQPDIARGVLVRDESGDTTTPIKHVIVIIGENHTYDNVFGTYQPVHGQSVNNLLSEGIVTPSGNLGPNVSKAEQKTATDTKTYNLKPKKTGAYNTLPQPNTTYAQGQPQNVPDARFPANLPNGPYQITKYVPYLNSYVGDPIHRFYQMWQQQDGGKADLYTWVHQTAGDDNGANPPKPIYQGALSMGYYNMSTGDAPYFKQLADTYSSSDNYHQAVMGGTGANHIMLGTGDAAYYQNAQGQPTVPPSNQIENPNPKPGTNNNYTQDGYSGGSYSNCSDRSQPGVGPVQRYIHSLPYAPFRNGDCAPGAYYLLNNYLPGYTPSGQLSSGTPYIVPPQQFPTIGDELSARNVTWKYYGQGMNDGKTPSPYFCGICDPFQYATSIMTTKLKNNLQDFTQFQKDVTNNTLPAVSFIKPDEIHDGHPASSSLSIFENYSKDIVTEVQSNPKLFKDTAIFITFDEGGGYYDSGYIQPLTFFGDGPRIPLMLVSPYAKRGYVDHTYNDHVSLLKFIETNWRLHPLSSRSLDNLPNPRMSDRNPYKPTNGPAIGNLMEMFNFHQDR